MVNEFSLTGCMYKNGLQCSLQAPMLGRITLLLDGSLVGPIFSCGPKYHFGDSQTKLIVFQAMVGHLE